MNKYLDSNGLLYLWSKTKDYVSTYVAGHKDGGTADHVAWENITGRPNVALKSDLTSLYRYKGSVTNYASLASLPAEDCETGDVWNVEATGMNYVWTGTEWDALGQAFEIQSISNAEIDSITGSKPMGFLDESGLAYFWAKAKDLLERRTAALMPAGAIVIWSGAADAVPEGWALCDGSNGTPDLRGRFVLGTGTGHTTGETGGGETVTLTVRQMPKHDHMLRQAGAGDTTVLAGGYQQLVKGTIIRTASEPAEIWNEDMDLPDYYPKVRYMEDTGCSEPHPNMPPYYTLAYIMKQ